MKQSFQTSNYCIVHVIHIAYIASAIILARVGLAFIDLHFTALSCPAWLTLTMVAIRQVLVENIMTVNTQICVCYMCYVMGVDIGM